jgi:hypothetical protein
MLTVYMLVRFHLEDEAASIELLREWRDQRWRPLFGSLKIDPALPTNDLVCTPWPKSVRRFPLFH